MIWYRININYLWNKTEIAAFEVSTPAGTDKEKAIEKYNTTILENIYCVDDKTKPAKIDLTKYIYNKKIDKTRTIVLYKNY